MKRQVTNNVIRLRCKETEALEHATCVEGSYLVM